MVSIRSRTTYGQTEIYMFVGKPQ